MPAAVGEARAHRARPVGAMTVHAVIGDEELRTFVAPRLVAVVRVRQRREPDRVADAGLDVLRMLDERRDAALRRLLLLRLLLRGVRFHAARDEDQTEKFFHCVPPSEKTNSIPPHDVYFARSGKVEPRSRTSKGRFDATSPAMSSPMSPPMPEYTAMYSLPSGPV